MIVSEVLPDPVAMTETVDVPGGVVGLEDPPHAEIATDPARPPIRRAAQNKRRTGGLRRFLCQKRIRPAKHAGNPAREASGAGVPGDRGRSSPTVPEPEPSVVRVIVVLAGLFDPSAVSVGGLKLQVAF